MRLSSFAAGCVLLATATPAAAQVTLTGVRDLAFGQVVSGVATHVLPSDAVRSGQFQLVTAVGTRVRLDFTLPNSLNGSSGATMPIGFGNGDGITVGTAGGSVPEPFNPKSTVFIIATSATTNIFLGGTVTPTAAQALGSYTNTITLTVTVQ